MTKFVLSAMKNNPHTGILNQNPTNNSSTTSENVNVGVCNQPKKDWFNIGRRFNNISDIKYESTVDGPGFRTSVYVSGCLFKCDGCFNIPAQSFSFGKPFTDKTLNNIISSMSPQYVEGISILGGDPILNLDTTIRIVNEVRRTYGSSKTIWVWTGFRLDELITICPPTCLELLSNINVLVDGPFNKRLAKPLPFCGSSNQRVIDMDKTIIKDRHIVNLVLYNEQ